MGVPGVPPAHFPPTSGGRMQGPRKPDEGVFMSNVGTTRDTRTETQEGLRPTGKPSHGAKRDTGLDAGDHRDRGPRGRNELGVCKA